MKMLLETSNINFRYNGVEVINIENFSVMEGEMIALVGPNGSGKSTLLNLVSLLLQPAGGEICIFGEKVTSNNRHDLRRRIGYVQQHPYLFNLTVDRNIELGLKLRGVSRHLRQTRTTQIIEQLKLGPLAGKRAHELSGGEVQKVALARALVLEPELLVLDEPFTYLDKSFLGEFESLLLSIRESRTQTVIFSGHDQMRAKVIADHVYSIIYGHLTEESLLNLFHGKHDVNQNLFDTGKINVHMPELIQSAEIIGIEPEQIVLSKNELDSSMQNRLRGEVLALHAHSGHIEVTVRAGERFQVIITKAALSGLGISIGDPVWISFKSSAIKILA